MYADLSDDHLLTLIETHRDAIPLTTPGGLARASLQSVIDDITRTLRIRGVEV